MKYITLNPIAEAGLARLPKTYEKTDDLKEADAVLVRSASLLETEFPEKLAAIARAGAGVNNIPIDRCAEEGIVVFNTPGANANGVKELTVLALMLAARDVKGGMKWIDEHKNDETVQKDLEKAKSAFAGTEVQGRTLGVIGLGAVGGLVANTAVRLGMKVLGYDPFLSVANALHLNAAVTVVESLDDLYRESDYITIHSPQNASTKGTLNKAAFDQMKDGVAVLNMARDGLVVDEALEEALKSGRVRVYVTDVPDRAVLQMEHVIAFPHLGASTEESETNCAIMAADELTDYLENGNITHSVNYPDCTLGKALKPCRICALHRNVPNVISTLTALLGSASANISDMVSKSRGDYAYAVFDMDHDPGDKILDAVRAVPNIIKVRVIRK